MKSLLSQRRLKPGKHNHVRAPRHSVRKRRQPSLPGHPELVPSAGDPRRGQQRAVLESRWDCGSSPEVGDVGARA